MMDGDQVSIPPRHRVQVDAVTLIPRFRAGPLGGRRGRAEHAGVLRVTRLRRRVARRAGQPLVDRFRRTMIMHRAELVFAEPGQAGDFHDAAAASLLFKTSSDPVRFTLS